jgi:hypothetical protein
LDFTPLFAEVILWWPLRNAGGNFPFYCFLCILFFVCVNMSNTLQLLLHWQLN